MFSLVESRKSKTKSQKAIGTRNRPRSITQNPTPNTLILIVCFFFFQISSYAQCAMYRAVLESEENGGTKAKAINDGIVYLMAFPYLLVGILGYIIYRYVKKKSELENLK